MIVYISPMRHKDEQKQIAIIDATIKLVNEIGFVSSSVAKIAREANVSPATIYIYYENKEDLLVSTYKDIKMNLGRAILDGIDESRPIRDIFEGVWFKMFDYFSQHPERFQFTEQFANSPYASLIDKKEMASFFEPLIRIVQRGIDQKIIKDVPFDILTAFIFYPVIVLSNHRICAQFERTRENIETAFTMAWDAIRL